MATVLKRVNLRASRDHVGDGASPLGPRAQPCPWVGRDPRSPSGGSGDSFGEMPDSAEIVRKDRDRNG